MNARDPIMLPGSGVSALEPSQEARFVGSTPAAEYNREARSVADKPELRPFVRALLRAFSQLTV